MVGSSSGRRVAENDLDEVDIDPSRQAIVDTNPFVGPRPIQQGEALYGRGTELRELYNQLQARRVVVLHSPSGAGKSSLVQAGLTPRLESAGYDVWKPIRVNFDPKGARGVNQATNRYLLSAMVTLEDELPAERRRGPAELAKLDFIEYVESRPRRKGRAGRPVVFLFDQFEELLTVQPLAIEAKRQFFSELGRALENEKHWALFILREDYLAALAPYRDLIPTQLSNTLRIEPLGLEGAREAAVKLAAQAGRSFPGVDRLIRDLAIVHVQQPDGSFLAEQGLHVEPVQLQVVCRRLWAAMPENLRSIDVAQVEKYADVSKSLAGYYSDAVREIAAGDLAIERAVREWVGQKLIVGGIRSEVRQEADKSAGLDNRVIKQLLDSYLVRTELRAGAHWFELSHDRLIEPVQQDNEAWEQTNLHPLQVQARLWERGRRPRALLLGVEALSGAMAWAKENPLLLTEGEREFLAQSRELRGKEQATRRRLVALATISAVVAMVVGVLGVVAWVARDRAEEAREKSEEARQKSEEAQEKSEEARQKSEESERAALLARERSEKSEAVAVQAQRENGRLLQQMFQVALRRFIEHLALQGSLSGEVVLDERWTPLLERNGQRFAAATVAVGDGRIIVAGNEDVLSVVDDRGDSVFLAMTVKWLLGDQTKRDILINTSPGPDRDRRLRDLEKNLAALGHEYDDAALVDSQHLADVGMLIIDNRWGDFSVAESAAVDAFIERGGGVLAVGAGWSWLMQEPVEGRDSPTLENYPMNQLLNRFGVEWSDKQIEGLEKLEEEATVRFENKLDFDVGIYALNSGGVEEYHATLRPGAKLDRLTALTHQWVVRRSDDNSYISETSIDEKEQTVVIGKKKLELKPEKLSTELPETLSNADLISTKFRVEKASLECGKKYSSLRSSLKVTFEVAPDGKVESARAEVPGLSVGPCVEAAVSGQRFPKSRAGVSKTWDLPLR